MGKLSGTCSIEECERPSRARGWCDLHYGRWQRTGNPLKIKAPHSLPSSTRHKTPCKVKTCKASVYARGYCKKHYGRSFKYGDPEAPRKKRVNKPRSTCGIKACKKHPYKDQPLCWYHRTHPRKLEFVCRNPACGILFVREIKAGRPAETCSKECHKALVLLRAIDHGSIRQQAIAEGDMDITLDEIYRRDSCICFLCGLNVKRKDASIDHIDALSKGGKHKRDRVVLAHRLCNQRKSARTLEEYLAIYPRKRELPPTHALFHLVGN